MENTTNIIEFDPNVITINKVNKRAIEKAVEYGARLVPLEIFAMAECCSLPGKNPTIKSNIHPRKMGFIDYAGNVRIDMVGFNVYNGKGYALEINGCRDHGGETEDICALKNEYAYYRVQELKDEFGMECNFVYYNSKSGAHETAKVDFLTNNMNEYDVNAFRVPNSFFETLLCPSYLISNKEDIIKGVGVFMNTINRAFMNKVVGKEIKISRQAIIDLVAETVLYIHPGLYQEAKHYVTNKKGSKVGNKGLLDLIVDSTGFKVKPTTYSLYTIRQIAAKKKANSKSARKVTI